MAIKHKFLIQQSGGYFYRIHPIGLFGEQELRSFHGTFKSKYFKKDDYFIIIEQSAEFTIKDRVLNTTDRKILTSEIEILANKELYNYPFIPGMNYLITPLQASII